MAESIRDIKRPDAPPVARSATGFESPAERSFGAASGASLRAEYQTEAEQRPWAERTGATPFSDELSMEDIRTENEAWAASEAEELALLERLEAEEERLQTSSAPTFPAVGTVGRKTRDESGQYLDDRDRSLATYRRYQAALMVAQRTKREHERLEAGLKRGIRKTFVLIVAIALFCALLADILSLADLGWVVSWSIPVFTGIMLSRMNNMKKSQDAIVDAREAAQRGLVVAQQRMRQAGLTAASTPVMRAQPLSRASSYVGTFIRDTVIVQLVELIPIIDFLPMYLGQVVKMMMNQNSAYREALKEFRLLETEHRALQALQQRELAAYARQLVQSQASDTSVPALRTAPATS